MTEQNKLTYSSLARSVITDYGSVLSKRFEGQYGDLAFENYQISSEYPFQEIVSYYANAFSKAGNWTNVDAGDLEWSTDIQAAGWRNKKNLFLIYSLTPKTEFDVVPVNTLSTVE